MSEEELAILLSRVSSLVRLGQRSQALLICERAFPVILSRRSHEAHQWGKLYVDLLADIGMPGRAKRFVPSWLEFARQCGRTEFLEVLWLAARVQYPFTQGGPNPAAIRLYTVADDVLSSIGSRAGQGHFRCSIPRDRAILKCFAHRSAPIPNDLWQAKAEVSQAAQHALDAKEHALMLEVLATLSIHMAHFNDAERSLQQCEENESSLGADQMIRNLINRAALSIATCADPLPYLDRAVGLCLQGQFFHYLSEIRRLERQANSA